MFAMLGWLSGHCYSVIDRCFRLEAILALLPRKIFPSTVSTDPIYLNRGRHESQNLDSVILKKTDSK